MKVEKITIGTAVGLANTIKGISDVDPQTGKPKYSLPIKFSWACSRTLKKLQEAIEPLQPKFDEIWKEWNESLKPDLIDKIMAAKGKKKADLEAQFKAEYEKRAEQWNALSKEEIEAEIFDFPKLKDNEIEQLDKVGFTPIDLNLFIEVMNLSLDSEAA